MRRLLMSCVLLMSLALAFVAPTSASAAGINLTIDQPTLVTPTSARLTGTATVTNQVRVDVWSGDGGASRSVTCRSSPGDTPSWFP